ncbi:hypothetical protein KOI35_23015 [Actinoplanes bogorensis]|uniref:GlsB/YeaQ/YmgE family stress response membrane protein n=1 Tax=Paractinoplanes bogorensis TaxID=1610840 RepID=A0ABS5YUM6_9ACTN|nr:hypothetical protein [Actinoplanes bogorensis]MBU2666379.1 hypothetical protein [Actinoplanes bogorensis]
MSAEWGAFFFGTVIGWFTYFVNRYRTEIKLADVASILGAIGGAAVLELFPSDTVLFGAYGIGLAVGFFSYFIVLLLLVVINKRFTLAWFLDGRRPKYGRDEMGPDDNSRASRPMGGGRPDDDDAGPDTQDPYTRR